MIIVFFDIGGTLASARLSSTVPPRLVGLDVLPQVHDILLLLQQKHLRMGLISNTGEETTDTMKAVLEDAGLYQFFDPALLIYSSVVGLSKDSPAIFQLAAQTVGPDTNPADCLFVGEDQQERAFAAQAGFRVASTPQEALIVVETMLAS